jgi:hypothetical protein
MLIVTHDFLMLSIFINTTIAAVCLQALLGIILGVEHGPYIYCMYW